MKAVIKGKLYDTENAQYVGKITSAHELYKTKKGNFFVKTQYGISNVDQEEIKEFVGKENGDLYIRAYGEVEEA